MARLDWDRLRRVRPLDGADARVDADGGVMWERDAAAPGYDADDRRALALGARTLRAGVVVRRAKERTARNPTIEAAVEEPETPVLEKCPKCGAMVSKRRMFRHSRVACRGRGRS